MKRIHFLSIAALTVLAALTGAVCAKTATRPSLKVTTLDGKTFDLAADRGKWVIVNFWATWCVPCIKEMPDISAFVAAHKNVAAVGLAFEDSDKAEVEAFVRKHPVSYPLAQVDVYKPPADFATPLGLPTSYLIAPDGRVAKKFVGPVTATDLKKAIAAGSAAK